MYCGFFLLLLENEDDELKFERIYNENISSFMKYATIYFSNNESDAVDAVNETFFRIAKNFKRIYCGDIASVNAFCFTILKNQCRTVMKRRVEINHNEILDMDFDIPSEIDFENIVCERELIKIIYQRIKSLPPNLKEVLVLYYGSKLSLWDVSKVLNVPISTVKYRRDKGIEILKEATKEAGF